MHKFWYLTALALLAAALGPSGAWAKDKPAKEYFVYIGTYTNNNKSKGIQLYKMDAATGKLAPLGLAGEAVNPSYVNLHPNGKYLYSVSEVSGRGGQSSGAVSAFSVEPATGKLTLLNSQPSRGNGPCFVKVDATGRMLMVANYGSGSVAALPIKNDGSLGEAVGFNQHAGEQPNRNGPHAHSANYSPDNRFAILADLGLDKLFVYKIDPATANFSANDPPFFSTAKGAGPRHFAFHPNGKFGYVINEIASTVTAMSYDKARGAFTELQTIKTLPEDFKGQSTTAEVVVHPSGKFLYGSNRGHDSITEFTIAKDGRLTLVGHTPSQGKIPRNFAIDPTGKWLIAAHQNSDNIVVFAIDAKTGKLTPTGQNLEVGAPVCVKFLAVR